MARKYTSIQVIVAVRQPSGPIHPQLDIAEMVSRAGQAAKR
jgi:hypothetical protein